MIYQKKKCEACNITCKDNYDYNRHINTKKHINNKLQLVAIVLTVLLSNCQSAKATYSATLEFFNEANF